MNSRLWASIITLSLLCFACQATETWSKNLSNLYIQQLEHAQSLTEENQWAEASEITQDAFSHWESQSFPLYVLLRHSDLDKILISFQSVSQYLQQEDQEPYLANNAQLIAQLKLLAEMEELSFKNIF